MIFIDFGQIFRSYLNYQVRNIIHLKDIAAVNYIWKSISDRKHACISALLAKP
jgi:hypothetical protein